MNTDFTGIILSGGKSKRMGEDKTFTLFSGRPLIEVMIGKLSPLFNDLLIVANNVNFVSLRDFIIERGHQKYNLRIEPDILKDHGPLGGIYTGLIYSKDKYNFIVACDMPFLNEALIRYMMGKSDGYDVVIAEWQGQLQPLCAVYSKDCITPIEKELSKNNLKITDFFKNVKVRVINEEEVSRFDPERLFFVNINTPQDIRVLSQ
ncbi:molybdenum cofactor guanylyltransferase [Candidatus Omnitrophota bacterium]